MNYNNGKITLYGSIISFSSGFLIPLGLHLLSNPTDDYGHYKNLKISDRIKLSLLNGVGGGFFVFGLYLLSPSYFRSAWIW